MKKFCCLSSPVNNLAEEIHKIKCEDEHDDIKSDAWKIKYRYSDQFLECRNSKMI